MLVLLAYSSCATCRKASAWLTERGLAPTIRPIVQQPPTGAELATWIPRSGLSVRKWLNTSGQSYRALGKEAVDAASDAELVRWLTRDGKLVKRPILVTETRVIVGFRPDAYADALEV